MGMFDTVVCRYPLPDGYASDDFQTKDFDCEMDTYVIEENGELWKRNEPWWANWPGEESETPPQRVLHHGLLRFYDYDDRVLPPLAPHDEDRWHEYEARFTDGLLVEVRKVVREGWDDRAE